MSLKNKSFIGIGWHFPPRFVKQTRTVEMVKDEEDIKESIINSYQKYKVNDRSKLLTYFIENKLKSLMENIGDF